MMSDHLAGMNEKLTQQKDEIDDLKAQLANTKSSASKVNELEIDRHEKLYFQHSCR